MSYAYATPRHATPRHATPRHATPRHATPRHATPRFAEIFRRLVKSDKSSISVFAYITFCMMWAICFGGAVPTAQASSAIEVPAPQFYIRKIVVSPQRTVIIDVDAEPGVDEVLHLMTWNSGTKKWQFDSSNDDYQVAPGTFNPNQCGEDFLPTSRLVAINHGSKPKEFLLIVRAKDIDLSGHAELCLNGGVEEKPSRVPVGGFEFSAIAFTPVNNALLHGVPTPNGSEWPVMLSFTDADGLAGVQLGWSGGAGGATQMRLPHALNLPHTNTQAIQIQRYFIGTPIYRDSNGNQTIARPGNARMYLNDVYQRDTDGDGLGDKLEASLGLCAKFDAINTGDEKNPCRYVADTDGDDLDTLPDGPKDTDRDGLPDGEELLGYKQRDSDPNDEDIAFPRWGADPKHKDIFLVLAWFHDLELDRIDLDLFSGEITNHFTPIVDNILPLYAAAPQSHVHNRDHKGGIRLHIDHNLDSNDYNKDHRFIPGREHISGILSHKVIREITPAFLIQIDGPVDDFFCLRVNNFYRFCLQKSDVIGKTPLQIVELIEIGVHNVWINSFDQPVEVTEIVCDGVTFRKEHLQRITQTNYLTRCDANAKSVILRVDTSIPGVHFDRALEVDPEETNVKVGLHYQSNYIFEEAYMPRYLAQRVRYGVITTGDNQSPGRVPLFQGRLMAQFDDPTSQRSIAVITERIAHELGHTVGLEHWGHYSWYFYEDYRRLGQAFLDELWSVDNTGFRHLRGLDLNYAPFYRSIMSYAFGGIRDGFSAYEDLISFNPSNMRETSLLNLDYNHAVLTTDNIYEFAPWHLLTVANSVTSMISVDWNRNRIIDPTHTTYNVSLMWEWGANLASSGRQVLSPQGYFNTADIVRATHASLPNSPGFIYGIYAEQPAGSNPTIYYQYAQLGSQAQASCTVTDNPLKYPFNANTSSTEGCLNWSEKIALPQSGQLTSGVSAAWKDDILFVAFSRSVLGFPQIVVQQYTISDNGLLSLHKTFTDNVQTRGKLELATVYNHADHDTEWRERLILVYNDPVTNDYRAYYWSVDKFVPWINFLRTTDGHQISGNGNPSLVAWPDPQNSIAADAEKQNSSLHRITCGVFPNNSNPDRSTVIRIYCLNPIDSIWRDVTWDVFATRTPSQQRCQEDLNGFWESTSTGSRCLPITTSPVELSMRYVRLSDGSPADALNVSSHFQMTYVPAPGDGFVDVWLSTHLHMATDHPLNGWRFNSRPETSRWGDSRWVDVWNGDMIITSPITIGTNVPMYDDHTMGSLFALGSIPSDAVAGGTNFFPHADASPNLTYWIGSDYRVMEDHICEQYHDRSNPFYTDSIIEQRIIIKPVVSCGTINVFH